MSVVGACGAQRALQILARRVACVLRRPARRACCMNARDIVLDIPVIMGGVYALGAQACPVYVFDKKVRISRFWKAGM